MMSVTWLRFARLLSLPNTLGLSLLGSHGRVLFAQRLTAHIERTLVSSEAWTRHRFSRVSTRMASRLRAWSTLNYSFAFWLLYLNLSSLPAPRKSRTRIESCQHR